MHNSVGIVFTIYDRVIKLMYNVKKNEIYRYTWISGLIIAGIRPDNKLGTGKALNIPCNA